MIHTNQSSIDLPTNQYSKFLLVMVDTLAHELVPVIA